MQDDVEERIRNRAYEIWKTEGCQPDRDVEYWTRAEREVQEESIASARALADEMVSANLPKLAKRTRTKTRAA